MDVSQETRSGAAGSWDQPSGATRYLRTIRSHLRLIILCAILCLAGAFAYVKVASKTYTATSEMNVNPSSTQDAVYFSLPVLHSTGVPTQDVLTAASQLHVPAIAQATVTKLRLHITANQLLSKVSIVPVGESNVLSISAVAGTAAQAERIANVYASEVVTVRTAALHAAIKAQLPGLKATAARQTPAVAGASGGVDSTITALEQLLTTNDPTVSVNSTASLPTAPTSPKKSLSLVAGLLIGILIGIAAAFGLDALDPSVRREDQLRERFRNVRVLARIPHHQGVVTADPLTPLELPPPALEQYRQLRATLSPRRPGGPVAYLMTGTSPAEGKTTSAINLAAVIAQSGADVILIEGDLRRPTIARTLNLKRFTSTSAVLEGEARLADALQDVRLGSARFRVLAAQEHSAEFANRLTAVSAAQLLESAKELADVVIIDSPPLTAVVDALAFAREVDRVVLATRIGQSKLSKVAEAVELLENQGAPLAGFVLIDVPASTSYGYGYEYDDSSDRSAQKTGSVALRDGQRNRDSRDGGSRDPLPARGREPSGTRSPGSDSGGRGDRDRSGSERSGAERSDRDRSTERSDRDRSTERSDRDRSTERSDRDRSDSDRSDRDRKGADRGDRDRGGSDRGDGGSSDRARERIRGRTARP